MKVLDFDDWFETIEADLEEPIEVNELMAQYDEYIADTQCQAYEEMKDAKLFQED